MDVGALHAAEARAANADHEINRLNADIDTLQTELSQARVQVGGASTAALFCLCICAHGCWSLEAAPLLCHFDDQQSATATCQLQGTSLITCFANCCINHCDGGVHTCHGLMPRLRSSVTSRKSPPLQWTPFKRRWPASRPLVPLVGLAQVRNAANSPRVVALPLEVDLEQQIPHWRAFPGR